MKNTVGIIGVAFLALLIGFVGFLYDRETVSKVPSSVAAAVPFTSLARGSRSKAATRVNYLITSANDLANLWETVDATNTPPAVDFKTQAVLAVFAGHASNSAIAVAKIEDTIEQRVVSITVTKPDAACAKKLSALSPYEIVVVPATSLSLTHRDLSTTAPCPK